MYLKKNERIRENKEEYARLKKDGNYEDAAFDPKTGGLKATHKGHNFDATVGAFGVARGEYEKRARDTLFNGFYFAKIH
ncbi:MAG: hypothetical protein LBR10_12150 [Prevotellaceae bacterium]|jgi:hypothetical protein|nr:hypothetical protein [Prevotellaceae bacterium]